MSESRRLRRARASQAPAPGAEHAPEEVSADTQHPPSTTLAGDPGAAREIAVPAPAPPRYPRASAPPDPDLHGRRENVPRGDGGAAPQAGHTATVPPEPAGRAGFVPDTTVSPGPQPHAAGRAAIGIEPGQTRLRSGSAKPPLGRGGWPLPTLTARQEKPRPWWLHPAFIVSIVLTFLAMAGMVTWAILAAIFSTDVVVSDLKITIDGGNAHLDWEGPDAEYSLYALGGGEPVDLSGLVRGTEVWLPSAIGAFDADTCFVVRSAEFTGDVSLSADALAAENAQSVCVSDAGQ